MIKLLTQMDRHGFATMAPLNDLLGDATKFLIEPLAAPRI